MADAPGNWACKIAYICYYTIKWIKVIPFEPAIWCTCTEYTSRPKRAGRRLYPRLCNIARNRHRPYEARPNRNNLRHSLPLKWHIYNHTFPKLQHTQNYLKASVAVKWRNQCECIRSTAWRRPAQILLWSESGAVETRATFKISLNEFVQVFFMLKERKK